MGRNPMSDYKMWGLICTTSKDKNRSETETKIEDVKNKITQQILKKYDKSFYNLTD